MRHRLKVAKLGRNKSHRKATLNALATALFRHKRIKTTLAKAKALRGFAEPLITKAKDDSVASRRYIARFIKDKDVLAELFNEIAVKSADRPGGYSRIVKLGFRRGDAAEMAIIELVDFSEPSMKEPKPKKHEKAAPEAGVVEEKTEKIKDEDVQDAEVVEDVKEDKDEAENKVKEETKSEEKTEESAEEVKEEPKAEDEPNDEPKAEEKKEEKKEDKK